MQKESQAALEERESERNANPAAASGASLEPSAAPAPGEDNPSGTGAAAVAGAAGGARRFLCGVVEGKLAFLPRVGAQHLFREGRAGDALGALRPQAQRCLY